MITAQQALRFAGRRTTTTTTTTAPRAATSLAGRSRSYATPASSPPPASSSSSSSTSSKSANDPYASSPWRQPLATTQTLTLFSTSPSALVFALEQSLNGALAALARSDPQGLSGGGGVQSDPREYVLCFAVDKTLPQAVLGEAIRMIRDIPIRHVGVLSSPIPGSLLPKSATQDKSDASSSTAKPKSYHSVALSLLPASLVTPFHSDIPGAAPVQAGRWATGKQSFDESQSRVSALDMSKDDVESPWKNIWGKENVSNRVPDAMAGLSSSQHILTLVFGSDSAPQGLIEGLDFQYGDSPTLGSIASNTVFETGGRERSLFLREKVPSTPDKATSTSSSSSAPVDEELGKIHSSGAVGLFFRSPVPVESRARPKVDVDTSWSRLISLGQKRKITRAKGNIVSELDGSNACQHFLRDVAEKRSSEPSDPLAERSLEAEARGMSREEQRMLSRSVKKEEDFWAALWPSSSGSGSTQSSAEPLLVTRILSGHPGRGTISLDTDLELETGTAPSNRDGSKPSSEVELQFFKFQSENEGSPTIQEEEEEGSIQIPGKDLAAWRLPRFLFLNANEDVEGPVAVEATSTTVPAGSENAEHESQQQSSSSSSSSDKAKAQVHALPNLFVLCSDGGFFARDPSDGSTRGGGGKGSEAIRARSRTWKLPGTRGWVDLRGR